MIEALRSLGLAARFVTDYLYLRGRDSEGYDKEPFPACRVRAPQGPA
jgi:transglutaminase-like putative cysteine protease